MKINKWLLIWNIILTVLILGAMFTGCSSIDPQFAHMANQIQSNRTAIEQLADAVNENRQLIQNQELQAQALQLTTETSISQLKLSLEKYVQEYVEANKD